MNRPQQKAQWIGAWPWLGILSLALLVLGQRFLQWPIGTRLQMIGIFAVRCFLQALPFVILSSIVSTIVIHYLRDSALRQLLPRSRSLSLLGASLLGVAFPVSGGSAAMMAERLAKQGASVGAVTAFLLAAPLVNPIVLASTYRAFAGSVGVTVLRGLCAWLLAVAVADLLGRLHRDALLPVQPGFYQQPATLRFAAEQRASRPSPGILIRHAFRQIYQSGRWLIIGILLVTAWQTTAPIYLKHAAAEHAWLTIPLMALAAWLLSVGPESDAWLVRSLLGQFAGSSLLAWLLLAPVIHLRNLRNLQRYFAPAFVRWLAIASVTGMLAISLLANLIGIGGQLPQDSVLTASWAPLACRSAAIPASCLTRLPDGGLTIESENFLEMMENLWSAGDEITGRRVEMTGFVYSDPTLGPEDFVLARMMLTAESRDPVVAGLLCRWQKRSHLVDGQWLLVQGTLGRLNFYDLGAGELRSMPFIQAEQLTLIEPPADQIVNSERR